MRLYLLIALSVLCLVPWAIAEDTRILMDSYVNGQPVKLMFDTGAEGLMLFRKTANRLQLSIEEPPSGVVVELGKVKFALTETCTVRLGEDGAESPVRFAVIDIPSGIKPDFDGVMGWGGIKHMMVEIDPYSRRVNIREKIPFEKSEWKCLDIRTDLNVLAIKTQSHDADQNSFLIDTGSADGLTITNKLWQRLPRDKTNKNMTLSAIYSPGAGLVVDQEKWIHEIDFGGLAFHEIPVTAGMEANSWLIKEGVDGIVGMWALSCFSWMVDGLNEKIYFKPNGLLRIPEKYDYNRLGAVFVPKDIETSNSLIAHVVKDGPAYAAGIRDGDELLNIGALDVTKWRTDPEVMPMSRFWAKPAGTEIDLVLMRDGKKIEITVTLEEIFRKK